MKLILAMLVMTSGNVFAASYKIDPAHSVVGFSVKHLMITPVKGRFNKFEGSFDFDEKKNEVSKIDVKLDAASIDTNDKKRDEHLASPDFFDVKKHAQISFKADKMTVEKDKPMKVTGMLTIKGVTKSVPMELTYGGSIVDPSGNQKVGFSLTGKIDRKEFGVSWNKTLDKGGVAVSDEVMINIDGEAQKVK